MAKEVGLKVVVPVESLASATVRVEDSVVTGFPYMSCRCTVMLPEATPAATDTTEEVNASLFTAAAEKAMLPLVTEASVIPPDAVAVKVIVSAPE